MSWEAILGGSLGAVQTGYGLAQLIKLNKEEDPIMKMRNAKDRSSTLMADVVKNAKDMKKNIQSKKDLIQRDIEERRIDANQIASEVFRSPSARFAATMAGSAQAGKERMKSEVEIEGILREIERNAINSGLSVANYGLAVDKQNTNLAGMKQQTLDRKREIAGGVMGAGVSNIIGAGGMADTKKLIESIYGKKDGGV